MPEPALQEIWNGASGIALANQSKSFYTKLRASYGRYGTRPLTSSSVLDFGCGWGRLTRYLSRDVSPGRLYGADPVEDILEVCRSSRIPAAFARSDLLPDSLPFDERFDLVFAFSVFTHLSEDAHLAALSAIHEGMQPDGVLIVTVRPPAYLFAHPLMRPLAAELEPDLQSHLRTASYFFAAHPPDPRHPQGQPGNEGHYGEAVLTLKYISERWSPWFELQDVQFQVGDLHQVMLTLKRNSASTHAAAGP